MASVPPSALDASRVEKDLRQAELPADFNIPDNYVDYTLKNTKPLPPITWNNVWGNINYLSLAILIMTPSIALYGAITTKLRWQTAAFSVFYYFVTGLGECSDP
jgi:stearoyl-CoA desaturase (delta-9 desaturase)